jgi:hypothetical protein
MPVIEQRIAAGVGVADIVHALNESGLELTEATLRHLVVHKSTFLKMMLDSKSCTGSDCLDTVLQLRRPLSGWLPDGLHGVT